MSETTAPLVLERRSQQDKTSTFGGGSMLLTPPVGEDYWAYRVRVADGQAIVGFPKFLMVGIGFAVEEDWNTNLPSTCTAEEIWNHIAHNAGSDAITREVGIEAIRLIQAAIAEDQSPQPTS